MPNAGRDVRHRVGVTVVGVGDGIPVETRHQPQHDARIEPGRPVHRFHHHTGGAQPFGQQGVAAGDHDDLDARHGQSLCQQQDLVLAATPFAAAGYGDNAHVFRRGAPRRSVPRTT